MTQELQNVDNQCFISYTRKDNTDYNDVADRLKTDLAGRFHATTGRNLRFFLDRESIGWGTEWRNEIRKSIESATFFLPIITMRYFESDACREELIAFYENAKQLGVTELIIPVVLAGANRIVADDPREEVRIIERLNHRNIEEAWLEGYESPAWRKTIHQMVNDIEQALVKAETAMTEREQNVVEDAEEITEEADLSDLGNKFVEIKEMTDAVTEDLKAFSEAAAVAFNGQEAQNLTPKQRQIQLVNGAQALRAQARDLSQSGTQFEMKVVEVDAQLRAIVAELREIELSQAEEQVQDLIEGLSGMDSLEEFLPQLDEMVAMMKFASLSNISIRKAIKPAISGMQSIRNALATAQSWKHI